MKKLLFFVCLLVSGNIFSLPGFSDVKKMITVSGSAVGQMVSDKIQSLNKILSPRENSSERGGLVAADVQFAQVVNNQGGSNSDLLYGQGDIKALSSKIVRAIAQRVYDLANDSSVSNIYRRGLADAFNTLIELSTIYAE